MIIKVLHVSIADSNGGAAIAAFRLHRSMNDSGVLESRMLVLFNGVEDKAVSSLSKREIMYTRFGNFINNKILCRGKREYGLFSFGLFGNDISNNQCVKWADVIYIHWINNGMLSWTTLEKVFSLNKPVFLFGHDMWSFTGGCHYSNGCENYLKECIACPFFTNKRLQSCIHSNYIRKRLAFMKWSNVKQIFPSTDFSHRARLSKIINTSKIFYVPNIIDTKRFVPNITIERADQKIKILFGALGGKLTLIKDGMILFFLLRQFQKNTRRR